MSHDHDHPHDKAHGRDFDEGPPSEYEIMSRAMQELLEAKGVITAEQIRRRMEQFEQDFPERGPKVIAHAWADTSSGSGCWRMARQPARNSVLTWKPTA